MYLGVEEEGIRAELADLHPAWTETVRVARDDAGTIAGAALVEWDDELGRAWIFGPWIDGDDEAWARWARGPRRRGDGRAARTASSTAR